MIVTGKYRCLVGGPQDGPYVPSDYSNDLGGVIRYPTWTSTKMATYTCNHLYSIIQRSTRTSFAREVFNDFYGILSVSNMEYCRYRSNSRLTILTG